MFRVDYDLLFLILKRFKKVYEVFQFKRLFIKTKKREIFMDLVSLRTLKKNIIKRLLEKIGSLLQAMNKRSYIAKKSNTLKISFSGHGLTIMNMAFYSRV